MNERLVDRGGKAMMTKSVALISAIPMVLLIGCESGSNLSPTDTATVLVSASSIDLSTVNAIEVTLDSIVLFVDDETNDDAEEAEPEVISPRAGLMLNLLDFQNGSTVVIPGLWVPAGEYEKLRMYIRAATLVTDDPNDEMSEIRQPINVPSRKVDVPVRFTVSAGESYDVVLDFDSGLSVKVIGAPNGNKEIILRPVITPVGLAR